VDDEPIDPPAFPVPTVTLIMDVDGGGTLMQYQGWAPLPLGARIEITNGQGVLKVGPEVPLDSDRFPHGRADAVVVGIRLWGAQSPSACLVLDVKLVDPGVEVA
jgi:hypothetical protein